ncbi:HutD family protein [Gluconacetobacter azotocaptans]|uniref:HutD family protein n=2 Tax=Gluconacetobacter azotocaptans TaxID=142834 RepID=A0A7W4JRY2_9PROT|nr:HutD family protein [Gluconacetobacter azotocaptans]MBB2189775.1 HutD family protein [Gluconacetobacter azotocaptans]
MRILRSADYRRMKWKNGGGETVEIAVFPAHATLDNFAWRISMATVASDGSFSIFADCDRTLSLLSGNGLTLAYDGGMGMHLTTASAPYAFPADAATTATLTDGRVTDLNVMSRRTLMSHSVARMGVDGETSLHADKGSVLFCQNGRMAVTRGGTVASLAAQDSLIIGDNAAAGLTLSGKASFFLIRFNEIPQ